MRGPRIGYNAGDLILLYFEPERSIHTFSIDYEIKQDLYPVLEFGWQNVEIDHEHFKYSSDGFFARVGADMNLFKYDNPEDYDMGFAGVRYGIAYMTHSARDIRIEEAYWGGISKITTWFGEGMPMLLGLVIAPLVVAILVMGKAEGLMEGVNGARNKIRTCHHLNVMEALYR